MTALIQTTPLLEKQRKAEQDAIAARHNGTEEEAPKSPWVIARLRKHLPPDHRNLAERLLNMRAQSLGYTVSGHEFVDNADNGAAIALDRRCDALTALHGYEAAVRVRIGHRAAGNCFWAIVNGEKYEAVAAAAGYRDGRGGYRALFVRLVQLVMIAAQDYDDEINRVRQLRY